MMNPKIDNFLEKAENWREEFEILREIILDCGLTEELKWGQPCYTFKKNNVVIFGSFKKFCTLSFFKGVLLGDPEKVLLQLCKNTQSVRVFQFTNPEEIQARAATIRAYIFEAIEIEKTGIKVEFKKEPEPISVELEAKFAENSALKNAFFALTPGRQRGYNLYFSAAKQSRTRKTRIEKYTQRILEGKGINDCVCGLSKKMPACDGSHKFI